MIPDIRMIFMRSLMDIRPHYVTLVVKHHLRVLSPSSPSGSPVKQQLTYSGKTAFLMNLGKL